MAEPSTPLAATHEEFTRARGDEADGVWAFGASWALLVQDVEPDVIDAELREVLALVREAQESPQELYGDAADWARERLAQWRAEGRRVLRGGPAMTWREVPTWGLAASSFNAVLLTFGLYAGGRAETGWTPGLLLLPVGTGLGAAAGLAAWETGRRRRTTFAAGAGVAVPIAAAAAAIAGVFAVGNDRPLGTSPTWHLLGLAALCGFLSRRC